MSAHSAPTARTNPLPPFHTHSRATVRASASQRGDVGLPPGLGPFRRRGRQAGARHCRICVFFGFRFFGFCFGSMSSLHMNKLDNSSPQASRNDPWISTIAADPVISHADARMAIAVASHADGDGTLKGRTATLAAACRIDRRRIAGHLHRLADAGYIRIVDMTRPGRFHVEMMQIDTGRASPFSTDPVERRRCTAAVTAALASMDGVE